LAVVIGRECKNVSRADALSYVLGYTCANDVSARDWQLKRGGGQWCRGKTFATFCPLGPCLVTTDEIPNPNALAIKTILNGQTMQDWNTSDMIFDVPTLIEFLSGSTILSPGTVILTGTPHGIGGARTPPVFLKHGDTVTIGGRRADESGAGRSYGRIGVVRQKRNQIRNPNLEIRNKSEIRILNGGKPQFGGRRPRAIWPGSFRASEFVIVSDFEIRISDL
jgi:2-keto-4-pentenoate hydratase/2-oxohepta-3-ene-1,7-dioic acid hydratase in catechol pathway